MTTLFTILDNRSLLRVGGPEALAFLQGLVSSDLDALPPDRAGFSTLLTPQGKILFEFFIIPDKDTWLLDCHADSAAALMQRLKLYRLRANITLEDISAQSAHGVIFGADISDTLMLASNNGLIVRPDPRLPALGLRVYGPHDEIKTSADLAAIKPATPAHYWHHCIDQGVGALGTAFGPEEMFLLDVNYDLLNAVSYQKGCFVGQEVTSRMKRKGEARKRTLILKAPQLSFCPGDTVTLDDAKVGTVLTKSDGIALAMVRRDRISAINTPPLLKVNDQPVTLIKPGYLPD